VARLDQMSKFAAPYLKKREKVLGAIRATAKGSIASNAMLGGAGAGFGYLLGTTIADGLAGAMVGGGIGGAAGMAIGTFFARFRMKRTIGIRGSNVTVVLTQRRLLLFTRSWLTSRPSGLAAEIPLNQVTSIETGAAKLIAPHPVTIRLDNGTILQLEAAKFEKPDRFVAAFRKATGR